MPASFRGALLGLPLLLLLGCSSSLDVQGTPPPNSGDPASTTSLTTPVFDPAKGQIPLPNILATATAGDPLASRPANKPMTPPEALAYVARYEMGGPAQGLPVGRSTNAVSGLNAPIYIRFTAPVVASTVTAANVKVFQLASTPTVSPRMARWASRTSQASSLTSTRPVGRISSSSPTSRSPPVRATPTSSPTGCSTRPPTRPSSRPPSSAP